MFILKVEKTTGISYQFFKDFKELKKIYDYYNNYNCYGMEIIKN